MLINHHLSNKILKYDQNRKNGNSEILRKLSLIQTEHRITTSVFFVLAILNLVYMIDVPSNNDAPYVPVSDPTSVTDSVVATIGQTPSELNLRIAQDVTVLREAFTPNGGIVITVHDEYGKLNEFSIA